MNKPLSASECDAVYDEALAFADAIVLEPLQTAVGLLMAQFNMDRASAAVIMAITLKKPRPTSDSRFDACMDGVDLIIVTKHSGKRVRLTPHDIDRICGNIPLVSPEAIQRICEEDAKRTKEVIPPMKVEDVIESGSYCC